MSGAWPLMSSLLSEALSAGEWLKAWDHCLTSGPRFFYLLLVSYLMAAR